jgi:hypothetical protein
LAGWRSIHERDASGIATMLPATSPQTMVCATLPSRQRISVRQASK